jgi:hypothetical protein
MQPSHGNVDAGNGIFQRQDREATSRIRSNEAERNASQHKMPIQRQRRAW